MEEQKLKNKKTIPNLDKKIVKTKRIITKFFQKNMCSICKIEGHTENNKKFHPKNAVSKPDIKICIEKIVDKKSIKNDILSAIHWKNTNSFKSIKEKQTQSKYYRKMESCEEVLQLVDFESKPVGTESEKIICEILNIGPRTSVQNDGTRNGKKFEIKSARYWNGKDDCIWQHLEPDHDYDYVLFVLLDFQGWKVWIIKKNLLMGEMREKNIVKHQGKQGFWVKKSSIISYLTPINTILDLDVFIR